jgi:hypothetical protein
MRRALIAAAVLLALPVTASAAPFGELPFRPVGGAATCLRATGAPGELVRWVAGGAEVLQARPDGLVPVATVPLGKLRDCPAVADASGWSVLAGATASGVRIALREPGGAWGPPITIAAKVTYGVEVAISARGDVLVAWQEPASPRTTLVRALRRPAGGAFGAPEQVGGVGEFEELSAGITAAGEALLAIAAEKGLELTTAPPGMPFTAPRRLVESEFFNGDPELAVAPDGRALLATSTMDGLILLEREPGADFVRRPLIGASSFDSIALALGPQGAAVVAWQSGGPGGAVFAMVRDSVMAFGAPVLVHGDEIKSSDGSLSAFGFDEGAPPQEGQTRLRAVLGADGRALLAWGTEGHGTGTATVTSAGRTEFGRLGSTIRDPAGVTPLLLAGGARAIAWSDGNGVFSSPPYAARLHLAIEGAAQAPAAPPPLLDVGAPLDRTLRPAQALVLPVTCRAACDIHASIARQEPEQIVSLPRAGTARVRFQPVIRAQASPSGKPVKVELSWSAPGAREAKRRTVAVPLRRLPAPPFPRIVNLRARRLDGGRVDVRWSTDVAVRDATFYVYGARTNSERAEPIALRSAKGGGRRSFHVTLKDAARARYVRVTAAQMVGRRTRTAAVRVR